MVRGIHHLGIAVNSIEDALSVYRDALGFEVEHSEQMDDRGLKLAMLRAGDGEVELLEPTDPASTVGRFVQKRGEGIHHVALQVKNIDKVLGDLKETGIRLIDEEARPGAGGTRVAFLHPKTAHGVLIELVEE